MRTAPSTDLTASGVVAVLRAPSAAAYLPVVQTLVASGVTSVELTLTTPGTLDALPALVSALPHTAEIGVGTVLTADHARAAIDGGARFLVTPAIKPDVIRVAVDAGIRVYPGAMTPTEVEAGWDLGATAVKVFPAQTLGPDYLRHLHGPFPHIPLLPSGGIDLAAIPSWIEAGAIAVSLGGPLLGAVFRDQDADALALRCRAALRAVSDARGVRR